MAPASPWHAHSTLVPCLSVPTFLSHYLLAWGKHMRELNSLLSPPSGGRPLRMMCYVRLRRQDFLVGPPSPGLCPQLKSKGMPHFGDAVGVSMDTGSRAGHMCPVCRRVGSTLLCLLPGQCVQTCGSCSSAVALSPGATTFPEPASLPHLTAV